MLGPAIDFGMNFDFLQFVPQYQHGFGDDRFAFLPLLADLVHQFVVAFRF